MVVKDFLKKNKELIMENKEKGKRPDYTRVVFPKGDKDNSKGVYTTNWWSGKDKNGNFYLSGYDGDARVCFFKKKEENKKDDGLLSEEDLSSEVNENIPF
jgi:hypothetical protein